MREWRGMLLVAAVVALIPVFSGFRGPVANTVLIVGIYVLLALGLNVVVGYTGLLDLGYVSFMAVGALVTCMGLMLTDTPDGWILPFVGTGLVEGAPVFRFEGALILILLAAGLAAATLGILRAIPTLRLTGDYYAIVTLGIAEILYQVFLNEETWTGGTFAIKIKRWHRPILFGEPINYATPQFYYLVLGVLVLAVIVLRRMERSRLGRAWASIRLDETAARVNGVNVSAYKLIAFAVSGFIGGVGGGLYAVHTMNVAMKSLDVWQSILILCAIVLGGMGSFRGALIGGAVLIALGEILRYPVGDLLGWIPGAGGLPAAFLAWRVPDVARFLFYGVIIIVMMRFRPSGLLPPRPIRLGIGEEELRRRAAEKGPLFHIRS